MKLVFLNMINQDYVYSKIGMALVSTQRVEFITTALVEILENFNEGLPGFTTAEFLEDSKKSSKKRHQTLGMAFKRLKLNPALVLADELDVYLQMRNIFVHSFWIRYLQGKSDEQIKEAIDFCYTFGRLSDKMESFFNGFVYSMQSHLAQKLNILLDTEAKKREKDYTYFLEALNKQKL